MDYTPLTLLKYIHHFTTQQNGVYNVKHGYLWIIHHLFQTTNQVIIIHHSYTSLYSYYNLSLAI